MNAAANAAWTYAGLTALAAAFQIALALGVPWGSAAMGGRFPGKFPPLFRLAAVLQCLVLLWLAVAVLHAANQSMDLPFQVPGVSQNWAVWLAVVVSAQAAVLNVITPSSVERRIWAPVAISMLASSVWVAIGAT